MYDDDDDDSNYMHCIFFSLSPYDSFHFTFTTFANEWLFRRKEKKNPSRYHNHRCAIGIPEKEAEDVEIVLTNARECNFKLNKVTAGRQATATTSDHIVTSHIVLYGFESTLSPILLVDFLEIVCVCVFFSLLFRIKFLAEIQ